MNDRVSLSENERAIPTSEALAGGVAVIPPPSATAPLAPTQSDHLDSPSDIADEKNLTDNSAGPTLTKDGSLAPIDTPPTPGVRPLSTARLIVVAAIVTCTMCLGAAGAMGLIIALPVIQTDLDMREVDLQWVSSVYTLTAGCFLLLAGRIADVHGRKLVFVSGVMWTAIWTLIGGFMNSGAALVVTRAMAGIGSAMRCVCRYRRGRSLIKLVLPPQ